MNWPDTTDAALQIAEGRHAAAIDRPETPEELRETIARRAAEGAALYPRGGGTTLHHGGAPTRPGVLIDTARLGRVLDYPAADMTITVEAGMTLGALQRTLAEHNQRLPVEAPRPDEATLGGIFATATCGPRRLGWGRPRDQVLGIAFATADGAIVRGGGRVVKNVAGYDLPKLLTGSWGTLGVICELTLKVRPRPETASLALVPVASAEGLAKLLTALNTSATRPVALDILNRSAARLALGDAAPSAADWTLVVGFEESRSAAAWQVDKLREELAAAGSALTVAHGDDAAPLWAGLAEFQAIEPGPASIRAGMKPASVPALLGAIDPDAWAVQVHAGSGILHGHALGDRSLDDLGPEVDRLRRAATDAGGYLTVPRCPSGWASRLKVWGDPRPDWALAARVKRALDPAGLMNPGRFDGII